MSRALFHAGLDYVYPTTLAVINFVTLVATTHRDTYSRWLHGTRNILSFCICQHQTQTNFGMSSEGKSRARRCDVPNGLGIRLVLDTFTKLSFG